MARRRWVALFGVVLVLYGCGVPSEDNAMAINDGVPPGLVASTTTTTTLPPTTTTTTAPPGTSTTVGATTTLAPTTTIAAVPDQPVGLYYVQDVGLVRVTRQITTNDLVPLDLRVALTELERGPQPEEGAELRSALPAGQVLDVQTSRGVAVVALAPTFRDIPDQQLAVAQIVLTLTERSVGQVQFTIDGERIQVPKADLSQTADPVVREDYSALVVTGPGRVPDTSPTPVVTPPTSAVGG